MSRPPFRLSPVARFAALCALPFVLAADSPSLVVSQVYGGGGGASSSWNIDFVEIYNRGGAPVSLSGYSIQYGSVTGNFTATALPAVVIPAGGFYLVQMGGVGGTGAPTPAPDFAASLTPMGAGGGKVALVTQSTALGCGATATPCALPDARILDLVAYGNSNNPEGSATAGNGATLTAAQGAQRYGEGCRDSDDNNADFLIASAASMAIRNSASTVQSCTFNPVITTNAVPDGEAGRAYALNFSQAGGLPPLSWSASGLPAGLSLSSVGALSGTPSGAGTFAPVVQVTDASGAIGSRSYTLVVQPALAISTGALPDGVIGSAYRQPLATAGGVPPCAWAMTGGALPPGLSFASSGVVYGIPSTAGNYSITVQVTDGFGAVASRTVSLAVQAFGFVTSLLPVGLLNQPYPSGTALAATGGFAPYYFYLDSGALPPGLALATSGALTGTPTAAGSYNAVFRVYDSNASTATRAFTLTVAAPPTRASWTARGLYGGQLKALRVSPDYLNDGTLFTAGGGGEVYRTNDRGQTWTLAVVDATRAYGRMNDIAVSPVYSNGAANGTDAKTLFALSLDLGVWKSTDGGASFAAANTGISCYVSEVCQSGGWVTLGISPAFASDHTLFTTVNPASGAFQLFKTTTGGASWSSVYTLPSTTLTPVALAVSPAYATDQTLFMEVVDTSTSTGYIYRSTNGGGAWGSVASFSLAISSTTMGLVISPRFASDRTLAAIGNSGAVYRSTDGGASFAALPAAMNANALAVVARPDAPARWIMSAFQFPPYLMASDDGMSTAVKLPGLGLPRLDRPAALAAATPPAGADPEIFGAHFNGIFHSTDAGLSFIEQDKGVAALSMYSLAAEPGGTLLGANGTGGWLRSPDAGANWVRMTNAPPLTVNTVALSPDFANDHVLFVQGGTGGGYPVYRSGDGGQTFTQVQAIANDFYAARAFKPGFSGTTGEMYWSTGYNGLYRSNDGGQTFAPITLPGPDCGGSFTYGAAFSPNYATDQARFVAGSNGLCKSVDGGTTWIPLKNGTAKLSGRFALSPAYNDAGAAGAGKTIIIADFNTNKTLLSTDGGATWGVIAGVNQATPYFSPAYAADGTVFLSVDLSCGCGLPGLLRSGNFGASFARLSGGDLLFNRNVTAVAFGPGFNAQTPAGVMVVSTSGSGLWVAADGGNSFTPISGYKVVGGLVNAVARAPGGFQAMTGGGKAPDQVDAVQSGSLLVATANQGVFQSDDNGATFTPTSQGLPADANVISIFVPPLAPTSALAGVAGRGLWRYNGATWSQQSGGDLDLTGHYRGFLDDGTRVYITCGSGMSLTCARDGTNCTGLTATASGQFTRMDYNPSTQPTFLADPAAKVAGPSLVEGVTASLWAVSQSGGPRYSLDNGASWIATPGGNDYALPGGQSWSVVQALGVNPTTASREVLAGSTTALWLSRDAGTTWRPASGTGSGLEATSKNFSATLSTTTAYGTTDVLVGVTGATNGGVYLSGDGGEHWTQVNQGFDPANLSISTLVKTSCAGCPVQYYSGSYGGGLYTRTIAVNPPPAFPSVSYACYGSTACACATGGGSGPEQGGQAFRLCGSNFQNGVTVEFGGVPAAGCAQSGGTVITCTGTPPHAPGYATVRVRNPDTRAGFVPAPYQYLGASSRAFNLQVAKSGIDAVLTWSCPGCTLQNPARIYRAQNAAFSLFPELYSAGTATAFTNTGAVGSAQSYFWSVE